MNQREDQSDQSFREKKKRKQKNKKLKTHHSSFEVLQSVVFCILSDSVHLS